MKTNTRNLSLLLCTLSLATAVAFGQTFPFPPPPPPPPGLSPERQAPGLSGTITAVETDGLAIKTAQGETATVKVTSETRFKRQGNIAKLADFQIGDAVVIAGERGENGSWNARLVATRPAEGQAAGPQADGKSLIFGQLKKIENTKLTIQRPDGAMQVVEVDEKTKILDGDAESIKLTDFTPGDRVAALCTMKNGVSVATELRKAPADAGGESPLPPPPPFPFPTRQQ